MNEAFFRAYYEAYNSGQEARLAEFLADDVVLVSAEGEQHGKEAYLATYRQILALFIDRMTPEEITIAGDAAAIQITDRFTARVDVPDFLGRSFAKGEEFTLRLQGRYQVRDGKIARIEIDITGAE
jgi:ketosteroid isomerase-like protein